ncbi:MAG: thermostable hemolysin [Dongiaceae bacterium]
MQMLNAAELRLHEHGHDDREEISAFIRGKFHQAYGATLSHLMPRLFSLLDERGRIVAAFGLREALRGRLFMETYLDHPVEHAIAQHAGWPVSRNSIMEVGNLATSPGGARAMIAALTCYLYDHGFEWIVFTGVAALRAAFHRLGMRPFMLAEAEPTRLAESERLAWGRYFGARPLVMGGHVPHGHRVLMRTHARRISAAARHVSVTAV